MSKKQIIILISIIFLGIFLLFFRLGRPDMLGDDAHYAFRSIGYFDYMASEEQTTPVQWLGYRPFWSFLSFHDHPPLYFLIQHVFFKIFRLSVTSARFPSALAAAGSIIAVFFLGRKLGGVKAGLFSAAALALNNYFIWTGRVGLLESMFIFFLLLGLLFLVKSFENEKNFLWTGLFFGLALLTKYTFFFALPGIWVYLIWRKRELFFNRRFWLGVLIFLAVVTPVVVYNLGMYETRGHFDVQFSDLFGQKHNDWSRLGSRVSGINWNPAGVIEILISGFSWPYFLGFLISIIGSLYLARKKSDVLIYLPVLIFFFLFLFFALIGNAPRWLGVISPFAALTIGFAVASFSKYRLLLGLVTLIGLFSIFYVVNTNILLKPLGGRYFYSDFRLENLGYNQLNKEISSMLSYKRIPPNVQEAVRLWWYRGFDPQAIDFKSLNQGYSDFNSMIVYDSNTNWFPTLWIFERWKLYHRAMIATTEEFFKILRDENGVSVLNSLQLEGLYLIRAGKEVAENSTIRFPETDILVDNFRAQSIEPKVIYDDKGREAFYIYYGTFK